LIIGNMLFDKKAKAKSKQRLTEDLKTNFISIMQEILSSRDDLCKEVDALARDNNLLCHSKEEKNKLTKIIIKKRTDLSKGIGIAANAPSVLPIVGAIGTTAFTSVIEFVSLIRLEIEMCLEIAYVWGNRLDYEQMIEAVAIIGFDYDKKNINKIDKSAIKNGVKKTMRSYIKKGILLAMERIVTRIELDALRKSLTRVVPFLGMPIAAGLNYKETASVGKLAELYYS